MGKSSHYKDEYAIKQFGRKVRELRLQSGMTIEQFANAYGLEKTQQGRIELGLNNVTISYIFRMAEIFKVPASSLLEFDQKDQ